MMLISVPTGKEMELCTDIIDVIGSYLTIYQRLPILSMNKSQTEKRRKVFLRIKKLYRTKSDILYQRKRGKDVYLLLPEPIYLKEYIETTPEIEKSNDIIEIYKDNILISNAIFPSEVHPFNTYSVNKLILLNRNGVNLNDYWWKFDQLETYLFVMLKHFPEYKEDRANYIMTHTNNRELIKMMRCQVQYIDTINDVMAKLIEYDLFYDEEYQLQVRHLWVDSDWYKALFSNGSFLLSDKSEEFLLAYTFPQKLI